MTGKCTTSLWSRSGDYQVVSVHDGHIEHIYICINRNPYLTATVSSRGGSCFYAPPHTSTHRTHRTTLTKRFQEEIIIRYDIYRGTSPIVCPVFPLLSPTSIKHQILPIDWKLLRSKFVAPRRQNISTLTPNDTLTGPVQEQQRRRAAAYR